MCQDKENNNSPRPKTDVKAVRVVEKPRHVDAVIFYLQLNRQVESL